MLLPRQRSKLARGAKRQGARHAREAQRCSCRDNRHRQELKLVFDRVDKPSDRYIIPFSAIAYVRPNKQPLGGCTVLASFAPQLPYFTPLNLGRSPPLRIRQIPQVHASAEKRVRPPIRPMQVGTVLLVSQPDAARDVGALDRQSLASCQLADFRDAHHEAELGSPQARVKPERCASPGLASP